MVKKHMRGSDGKYHINGKKYDVLEGSRAQVMHGTAYKTSGGLTKKALKYNKHGGIVSVKKSNSNPLARLTRAGYRTVKGKFGSFKSDAKGSSKKRKTRKHKRKGRGSKKRGLFLHERRGSRGRFRRLG
jgi:hypothetical protein